MSCTLRDFMFLVMPSPNLFRCPSHQVALVVGCASQVTVPATDATQRSRCLPAQAVVGSFARPAHRDRDEPPKRAMLSAIRAF